MPQRTNQFQRLAAHIHTRLSKGWKVEESKFLADRITGEPREVDVTATATIGSHQIVLSVECRDHRRPADTPWVESMAQKHANLDTSKLVLWSRSGFTAPAAAKAKFLNIDTVSARDVGDTDWAKFARASVGSKIRLVTPAFQPKVLVATANDVVAPMKNPELAVWFDEAGEIAGSMPGVLNQLLTDEVVQTVMLDHAPLGSGDFWAHVAPPEGRMWYVQSDGGERYEVRRISVGIKTMAEEVNLQSASAPYDGKIITLASGLQADGRPVNVYVEESPPSLVSLHTDSEHTGSKAQVLVQVGS